MLSEAILEAARASREGPSRMMDVMLQDHERATGLCYIERRVIADTLMLAAGAGELANLLLDGLEVNSARMQANLELTNGLMMAESATMLLSRRIGRHAAHQREHHACLEASASDRLFKEILLQNCDIGRADLENALDPAYYLGSTDAMIDSVLERTSLSLS